MKNVQHLDMDMVGRLGNRRREELGDALKQHPLETWILAKLADKKIRELSAIEDAKAELEAMLPSAQVMRIVGKMTVPEFIDLVYGDEKSASKRRKRHAVSRHWHALTSNPRIEDITSADVDAFEQKALDIWRPSYIRGTLIPVLLAALRKTPYAFRFPSSNNPDDPRHARRGKLPRGPQTQTASGQGGSGRIEAVERNFEREPGKVYLLDLAEQYCKMKLTGSSESAIHKHYYSVRQFSFYLAHHATTEDLTEGTVLGFVPWIRNVRKLSDNSASSLHCRILALWKFAWRRGHVTVPPEQRKYRAPIRTPVAWTMPELQQLWRTCEAQTGQIFDVDARLFWLTLHAVAWDTAERITALLSARFEDIRDGWLMIDGNRRKGKREEGLWKLHPETLALLEQFRDGLPRGRIWPVNMSSINGLYNRYDELLEQAGLPRSNRDKFHKLRKSAASHLKARGGDPTLFLGHANPEITGTYLDPRIVGGAQASDMLPRMNGEAAPANKADLAAAIRELTAAAAKLNAAS